MDELLIRYFQKIHVSDKVFNSILVICSLWMTCLLLLIDTLVFPSCNDFLFSLHLAQVSLVCTCSLDNHIQLFRMLFSFNVSNLFKKYSSHMNIIIGFF